MEPGRRAQGREDRHRGAGRRRSRWRRSRTRRWRPAGRATSWRGRSARCSPRASRRTTRRASGVYLHGLAGEASASGSATRACSRATCPTPCRWAASGSPRIAERRADGPPARVRGPRREPADGDRAARRRGGRRRSVGLSRWRAERRSRRGSRRAGPPPPCPRHGVARDRPRRPARQPRAIRRRRRPGRARRARRQGRRLRPRRGPGRPGARGGGRRRPVGRDAGRGVRAARRRRRRCRSWSSTRSRPSTSRPRPGRRSPSASGRAPLTDADPRGRRGGRRGRRARLEVHLEVETGLGRGGVLPGATRRPSSRAILRGAGRPAGRRLDAPRGRGRPAERPRPGRAVRGGRSRRSWTRSLGWARTASAATSRGAAGSSARTWRAGTPCGPGLATYGLVPDALTPPAATAAAARRACARSWPSCARPVRVVDLPGGPRRQLRADVRDGAAVADRDAAGRLRRRLAPDPLRPGRRRWSAGSASRSSAAWRWTPSWPTSPTFPARPSTRTTSSCCSARRATSGSPPSTSPRRAGRSATRSSPAMSRRLPRVYHAAGSASRGPDARGREVRVARIELWNGDICDLEVDAIVSPAVDVAVDVHRRRRRAQARPAATRSSSRPSARRPVELGDAIVTPAGRLAAKVVIHAVSLERDRRTSGPAIDRAARSAMARVRELGLASVAFPALGTGIGGFPLDEAASDRRDRRARRAGDAVDDRARHLRPPRRRRLRGVRPRPRPAGEPGADAPVPLIAAMPRPADERGRVSFQLEPFDERREALVEAVAREIRLRGLTGPAVHFLEASRPYRPLGAPAMLFFDPVLRELFGGESPSATRAAARRRRHRGPDRPARGAGRGRRLGRLTRVRRGRRRSGSIGPVSSEPRAFAAVDRGTATVAVVAGRARRRRAGACWARPPAPRPSRTDALLERLRRRARRRPSRTWPRPLGLAGRGVRGRPAAARLRHAPRPPEIAVVAATRARPRAARRRRGRRPAGASAPLVLDGAEILPVADRARRPAGDRRPGGRRRPARRPTSAPLLAGPRRARRRGHGAPPGPRRPCSPAGSPSPGGRIEALFRPDRPRPHGPGAVAGHGRRRAAARAARRPPRRRRTTAAAPSRPRPGRSPRSCGRRVEVVEIGQAGATRGSPRLPRPGERAPPVALGRRCPRRRPAAARLQRRAPRRRSWAGSPSRWTGSASATACASWRSRRGATPPATGRCCAWRRPGPRSGACSRRTPAFDAAPAAGPRRRRGRRLERRPGARRSRLALADVLRRPGVRALGLGPRAAARARWARSRIPTSGG